MTIECNPLKYTQQNPRYQDGVEGILVVYYLLILSELIPCRNIILENNYRQTHSNIHYCMKINGCYHIEMVILTKSL